MNEIVRNKLIEVARKRSDNTISYQELSDSCGLGLVMRDSEFARAEIGRILGEISRFEHEAGRPLLSSLVVSKGISYQGDGFYKLCEELGFGPWKKLRDDIAFEMGQMNAAMEFWSDDSIS